MKSKESNKKLVTSLKNGDMKAFDTIYESYSYRLYSFVLRYIKIESDAEEIVQEIFIKIWETRNKIDIYSSFESFLFTITYNATISLLRKRVSEQKYLEHLKQRQQIISADEIIDEIHFKELNGKVRSLLNEFTPRQQEIFRLSREEGLTHEEIASKLNISPNTVKNHLVKVLSSLRSRIGSNLLINLLFINLFL